MSAFGEYQAAEERLRALAGIGSALAVQIAELVELRERVRQAQLSAEYKKPSCNKRVIRPGRLFMQNQWMMGRIYHLTRTTSQF
jgi:DNA repair protein RadC